MNDSQVKQILVIGHGGREHALAWKLRQSPGVQRVYVAPGNAGTAREPGVENVPIPVHDLAELQAFATANDIDLTVVGPEVPLSLGLVDAFTAAGLRVFGPTRAAAELESSKAYAKQFLAEEGIASAHYAVFSELEPALQHVRRQGAPIVVKADGLAAGKGVVVAQSVLEAEVALRDMLGAGQGRVVVEQFLEGEELSYIVIANGDQFVALSSAQDHKRVGEGDTGPNTGGMGAYSPAPIMDAALEERIQREVIAPTLRGMQARGRPFCGFLYAGLMIQPDASPMVLEFNTRLGDPETQPLLLRLESDLTQVLLAALDGTLRGQVLQWDKRVAIGVVMAAAGYPGEVERGARIDGLDRPEAAGIKVFHAGTSGDANEVRTAGGRVLTVCALGSDVAQAQALAYRRAREIHWPGCFYRGDIGWRACAREQA